MMTYSWEVGGGGFTPGEVNAGGEGGGGDM